MSAFINAAKAGYTADEILKHLIQSNPKLGKRIQQAMGAGYTAEQIAKHLTQRTSKGEMPSMSSLEKVFDTNVVRQQRAKRKRGAIEKMLDPNKLLSIAGGALLGGAVGGPAGAIAGGVGAGTTYMDLLNSYEDHIAQGGTMGFTDFVRAFAKGGLAGAGAYGAARAMGVGGAAAQQTQGQQSQPENMQAGEVIDVTPEDEEEVIGESQELAKPENVAQAEPTSVPDVIPKDVAREMLNKYGLLSILDNVIDKTHQKLLGVARAVMSPQAIKDMEKASGLPVDEIIRSAYQEDEQAPEGQLPEEQPPQEVEAAEPHQPTEQAQEPQLRPVDEQTQNAIMGTFAQAGIAKPGSPKKARRFDPVQAIPSSTIRSLHYNAKDKYAQALFQDGSIYEYFNVPEEDLNEVRGGNAIVKGEGENAFRIYYPGKDPSVGAAFDRFIKKGGYDYNKITDDQARSKHMLAVKKSDRIHKAADTADTFSEIFERAKTKQQAIKVKEISDVAASLDDELLEQYILEARLAYRKLSKEAQKQGKRKQTATSKRVAKAVEKRVAEEEKKRRRR